MPVLTAAALRGRAPLAAPGGPFAALARSLATDLDAALAADVHVADRKARLTRAGGRCPVHGAEFAFDPFTPRRFRCDACRRDYTGDAHHEFWLYRYQLWLAERAVHAAALHALLGRPAYAAFAGRVLAEAADAYPRLPNRDNVLGPSRPFFSTYLESLWLLSLCVALDLLEARDGPSPLGARVRDTLVAPSRTLIASYPEGRSNRQVWNAAALLAAARLLGDAAGAEQAAHGPHGLAGLLRDGLLPDGTWWEGDNYHQFAHRGLWYGVLLAEGVGLRLDPALVARFDRGWAAPFLMAMPHAVLPARRDAQFGVSLRQWRWAEWLELGVARTARAAGRPWRPRDAGDAPRGRDVDAGPEFLARWLHELYDRGDVLNRVLNRETGRWRASGEAEINEPAAQLTRASLGWKALLFADPDTRPAPAEGRAAAPSVVLPAQGVAVLRDSRAPWLYASLDYGPPGGGHGHADRLAVQVAPFLLDPGTGSYVDRTLHWYRSTLAHAAPLVGERSQPPATGRLIGFDVTADPDVQVVGAEAPIAPGVLARRWLVLTSKYLVDHLSWTGLGDRTLDLPVGGAVIGAGSADPRSLARTGPAVTWRAVERPGAGGLEDGFDFLTDVEEGDLPAGGVQLIVAGRDTPQDSDWAWLHVHAPPGATLWRAEAPLAPGHGTGDMCAVRARGDAGAIVVVYDFDEYMWLSTVAPDGCIRLPVMRGQDDVLFPPTDARPGWRLRREREGRDPREVVLAVDAPPEAPRAAAPSASAGRVRPRAPVRALPPDGSPLAFALGEPEYRRTEVPWTEAGRPTADVTLARRGDRLVLEASIALGRAPSFAAPGDENPLDNERAAVNSDGLQLHLAVDGGGTVAALGAWLLVPAPRPPDVAVVGTAAGGAGRVTAEPAASWASRADGWTATIALPLAPIRARLAAAGADAALVCDVLINEKPPGRERRRGQLVLAGLLGPDERAYLAGDRHDPARGVRLALPDA